MQASLLQKLGILDCAVLMQNTDGSFTPIHFDDVWFPCLFPYAQNHETISMENTSAYLTDFMYDANEFWQRGTEGRINSGIWSEQTDQKIWRLEASAITSDNIHYLILTNLENEHNRRQSVLQIARELLISNDKILEEHELAHKRIASLSHNMGNLIEFQSPVKELLENAEFGIAIADINLQPLQQNRALYDLFDIKNNLKHHPLNTLIGLCDRQFPEFQRVLATKEKWSGEVYWMKPDKFSRWLHLTICPVRHNNSEFSYWLFLLTDVSREKYLQQSNEKLTYFDVMTNLPNRQYFWQNLENAIEQHSSLFVLQINIKHIKRINEVYGYALGDDAIKEVVSRLTPLLKDQAILARLSGNEFAMILYETKKEECKKIAHKLIAAACKPIHVKNQYELNIGIHIGIAHYPTDAFDAEELMRQADLAAFYSKSQRGNSVHFYSEELKEHSRKKIELEAAILRAITEKQFVLYLQPIYDLASGEVVKAEALIRWNRPDIGLVFPDEFIPIAEKTGMIIAIGQWVINESIKLLDILHQQNKYITLSVNLSPVQIKDPHLLTIIKDGIKNSKINAAPFLELELTESVLIEDVEKIQFFLEEVRKLGITVAIDDFGTGYSSLCYLQKLPIDHLKIDRSFVQDLPDNKSNCAIVLAIIAMAKSLNLSVIAEGVENKLQEAFLKENTCQLAQGYHFCKPIPFDEFVALSSSWKIPNSAK